MRKRRVLPVAALAGTAGLVWICACQRDVHIAKGALRSPQVGTVTYYEQTLDKDATPQQVAYAALRAIRDDVLATDQASREAALDVQFDLCAANVLAASNPGSRTRDEFIYGVVHLWAPTVSHYVRDFPTDWESASRRLVLRYAPPSRRANAGAEECDVLMEAQDPSGDPNAQVVIVVYLTKDSGYWRVTHLGFDYQHRTIGGRPLEEAQQGK